MLLYFARSFIPSKIYFYIFFLLLLVVMEVDVAGEWRKRLPLGKAVIVTILFVVFSYFLGRFFPSPYTYSPTLFGVISTLVLAPVFEELFFRKAINTGVNDIVGALLSSALFAVFHAVPVMPSAFFAGLFLFTAYKLTGSIKVTVIAHAVNNLLALLYRPETIEYFKSLL